MLQFLVAFYTRLSCMHTFGPTVNYFYNNIILAEILRSQSVDAKWCGH